jgi:hypothetical protein
MDFLNGLNSSSSSDLIIFYCKFIVLILLIGDADGLTTSIYKFADTGTGFSGDLISEVLDTNSGDLISGVLATNS